MVGKLKLDLSVFLISHSIHVTPQWLTYNEDKNRELDRNSLNQLLFSDVQQCYFGNEPP